jgi:hypothetical protein
MAGIALMAVVCVICGCSLMHELQPHRLQRWNRGPAPGRDEVMFSVSDPLPRNAHAEPR